MVGFNKKFRTFDGNRPSPPCCVFFRQPGSNAFDAGDFIVFTGDIYGSHQKMDVHAFFFRFFDFLGFCEHFRSGSAVDDMRFTCTESKRHPGGIQRAMAAADHNDLSFDLF